MKEREDLLLSRVADRTEDLADWDALDRIAMEDPAVWRRLASTLRSEAALRGAFAERMAAADSIEAPVRPGRWAGRFRPSRWAAAACVIVLGALAGYVVGRGAEADSKAASPMSPEDHLTEYLRRGLATGTVVGQLPDVVVRHAATQDGSGMELLVMRRVVERRPVEKAIDVSFDELGRRIATPVTARAPARSRSF